MNREQAIMEAQVMYNNEIKKLQQQIAELKQSQKQLAIEELEKLREIVDSKTLLAECIDNQIKSLKGEE